MEGDTGCWELGFSIAGHPIARETIQEHGGLRNYHTAAMCKTLRQLSDFLTAHLDDTSHGRLGEMVAPLEEAIASCLKPPGLSSAELRSLFSSLEGQMARLLGDKDAHYNVKERSALTRQLESLMQPARAGLSVSGGVPSGRSRLEQGCAIEAQRCAVLPTAFSQFLTEIQAKAPADVEHSFNSDFPRDGISQAERYWIGGEPPDMLLAGRQDDVGRVRALRDEAARISEALSSPELSDESRTQLEARKTELESTSGAIVGELQEHALGRLRHLSMGNSDQERAIKVLFTQIPEIRLKRMAEAALADYPVGEEDRLALPTHVWSTGALKIEVGLRKDHPWIVDVTFSFEAKVPDLQGFDRKRKERPRRSPLQPESTLRLEVKAEIEAGRFRAVAATFDANLVPCKPAAEQALSGEGVATPAEQQNTEHELLLNSGERA